MDVEIRLEPGGIGELSVYWNEDRISMKGDSIEQIIEAIRKKQS